MAKSDVDRTTDEKVAKGGVLAKLYFDMQNKDKEKLQPLLPLPLLAQIEESSIK